LLDQPKLNEKDKYIHYNHHLDNLQNNGIEEKNQCRDHDHYTCQGKG
jgi:hypothetical protein